MGEIERCERSLQLLCEVNELYSKIARVLFRFPRLGYDLLFRTAWTTARLTQVLCGEQRYDELLARIWRRLPQLLGGYRTGRRLLVEV